MQACCHQSGDMRHIHHQVSAYLIGNLPEALEINCSRIGAGSGDNQLRLALLCNAKNFVIVQEAFVIDTVRNDVEIGSGEICGASVGQMSAIARFCPIMVSPGFSIANCTAILAWAPEWG